LSVLKVLEQLPEGLAIAVLAASRADLERHLIMLPASLHPLAVEAAFPIHQDDSLTLDFSFQSHRTTANAVLEAATTGTTKSCSLKTLTLRNIPVSSNDRLQHSISAACISASYVQLTFTCNKLPFVPSRPLFPQLQDCLAQSSALTSLQLHFKDDPWRVFHLEFLFQNLTGLQSLELASFIRLREKFDLQKPTNELPSHDLSVQRGVANLCSLTRLRLGPGFHLRELPQILPNMTRLQDLCLWGEKLETQGRIALSTLTTLQTLKLNFSYSSDLLPSVATLTALQTLDLKGCDMLGRIPPLDALTALQTLLLGECEDLEQLPPLHNLTALRTLKSEVRHLQDWPGLNTLPNLQTLKLFGDSHTFFSSSVCYRLPHFADLASLQKLTLREHYYVQELPRLDAFKNLRTLKLILFLKLQCCHPWTLSQLCRRSKS
jgi:Leucine-rich repeat (LRR) protein